MIVNLESDYRRLRAKQYPSTTDQIDVLWKIIADLVQDGTIKNPEAVAMLGRVRDVKARYPK